MFCSTESLTGPEHAEAVLFSPSITSTVITFVYSGGDGSCLIRSYRGDNSPVISGWSFGFPYRRRWNGSRVNSADRHTEKDQSARDPEPPKHFEAKRRALTLFSSRWSSGLAGRHMSQKRWWGGRQKRPIRWNKKINISFYCLKQQKKKKCHRRGLLRLDKNGYRAKHQKTDVQQDEKINTATFTPNLGTVSCSTICMPSIKGQVHVLFCFFKKSLNYLVLFHWYSAFYSYLTCAAENALLREWRWSRDSFICVLILAWVRLSTPPRRSGRPL